MRAIVVAAIATAACATAGGVEGTFQVTGVIRYEDRAPLDDGSLADPVPAPARGVTVAVIDDDTGDTLVAGVAGDDGAYLLSFDAARGDPVHLLVATSSTVPARSFHVIRLDGRIHGFGGATFRAGIDTSQDLLVTVASGEAQAFNVFDQLITANARISSVFADPAPPTLTVTWEAGNMDGTFYIANQITLLGHPSDDDGFDDTVILHEIGHWVEEVEGRSDSPGGDHDGSPTDPRLAWSEGFATYWAMAVRDQPLYMDSNASGGWSYNADREIFRADPTGALDQAVSENTVNEILWDLGDVASDDDDPSATAGHDPVLRVQRDYLRPPTALRAAGATGVDLVDQLDGWLLARGLGACEDVRTIVNNIRGFPYDFGGPAGACP